MKRFNVTGFAMVVLLAIGVGAGASDGSADGAEVVVLTVHGLSCPLCAHNLDGQLKKIEGVEDATIDLKTGSVTVRLARANAVSDERLTAAVKDAGFTLKKISRGPDGS